MIDPVAASQIAMPGASPRTKDDPVKVQNAAKQFEALLMGQMMKSMHDSEGGWMGTGSDDSASAAMDYGTEIFAQAMANNGGLGLASMISAGLQKAATKPVEP